MYTIECTKEGLLARREQGIVLGKPKEVVKQSMSDADRERILHLHALHLHALSVLLAIIVDVHLK